MSHDANNTFVVLSPHLDDAVLSCGPLISAWLRDGREVVVATVFTASGTSVSAAMRQDAARYNGDVMTIRRAEEAEARRVFGYDFVDADLPELLFRSNPDGSPRCASLGELYGHLTEADVEIVGKVGDFVSNLLSSYPQGMVCAPFALGDHIDHHVVRQAAENSVPASRLTWYRDLPYAFAYDSASLPGIDPLEARYIPLDIERWISAIKCYPSQLGNMFGEAAWEPRFRAWAESGHIGCFRRR